MRKITLLLLILLYTNISYSQWWKPNFGKQEFKDTARFNKTGLLNDSEYLLSLDSNNVLSRVPKDSILKTTTALFDASCSDSSVLISITQNVYSLIPLGSLVTEYQNNGVLNFSGDSVQVNTSATLITDLRLHFQGGAAPATYNLRFYINGIPIENRMHIERSTTTNAIGSASTVMSYSFTTGDWLSIKATNTSSNEDITINDLSLLIYSQGGSGSSSSGGTEVDPVYTADSLKKANLNLQDDLSTNGNNINVDPGDDLSFILNSMYIRCPNTTNFPYLDIVNNQTSGLIRNYAKSRHSFYIDNVLKMSIGANEIYSGSTNGWELYNNTFTWKSDEDTYMGRPSSNLLRISAGGNYIDWDGNIFKTPTDTLAYKSDLAGAGLTQPQVSSIVKDTADVLRAELGGGSLTATQINELLKLRNDTATWNGTIKFDYEITNYGYVNMQNDLTVLVDSTGAKEGAVSIATLNADSAWWADVETNFVVTGSSVDFDSNSVNVVTFVWRSTHPDSTKATVMIGDQYPSPSVDVRKPVLQKAIYYDSSTVYLVWSEPILEDSLSVMDTSLIYISGLPTALQDTGFATLGGGNNDTTIVYQNGKGIGTSVVYTKGYPGAFQDLVNLEAESFDSTLYDGVTFYPSMLNPFIFDTVTRIYINGVTDEYDWGDASVYGYSIGFSDSCECMWVVSRTDATPTLNQYIWTAQNSGSGEYDLFLWNDGRILFQSDDLESSALAISYNASSISVSDKILINVITNASGRKIYVNKTTGTSTATQLRTVSLSTSHLFEGEDDYGGGFDGTVYFRFCKDDPLTDEERTELENYVNTLYNLGL